MLPPRLAPASRSFAAVCARLADGGLLALALCSPPFLMAQQPPVEGHQPFPAVQQPSLGPLTWEEGSPLQRMAYTPVTETAEPLARGDWSVDVYNGFSNIFEQDSAETHLLFLDMERLTTAVTVRWGASASVEVGGRVALESTGGGVFDGVIKGWHEQWGFGQANRDRFPDGGYRQLLTDGDGEVYLDKTSATLGIRDVRAFAKWAVWRAPDGRSLLSLRSALRIPMAGPLEGNDRVDGAIAALWRQGMGAWYAHGMVGLSVSPPTEAMAEVLRGRSGFLTLGLERPLGSRVSALAQLQLQSAQLRSFDHREVDRAPTNLLVGLAGRFGESWTWDASFQEDVPADTPAVDFTLALRVSRRW